MRLLNVNSLEFTEFRDDNRPKYVIASHRWVEGCEVTLRDVRNRRNKDKSGYKKILDFTNYVREYVAGVEWLWVDTCCIDKTNAAELSKSLNLMFEWYSNAVLCIAYLADVKSAEDKDEFQQSEWFKRGWTLQELLAPRLLVFVTETWKVIGNKGASTYLECGTVPGPGLEADIATITGLPERVLRNYATSIDLSVDEKLKWMDGRTTTEPEDMSYALYGIIGVTPGANYGEKYEGARQRLLAAIHQRDSVAAQKTERFQNVVAWPSSPHSWTKRQIVSCLAKKDSCYCRCHSKIVDRPSRSQYIFTEVQGWQAIGQACNVETCTARIYGIQFRVAIVPSLLPFTITAGLQITDSWIPKLILRPDRVCDSNGLGFRCLQKLESGRPSLKNVPRNRYGQVLDRYTSRKVASFKQLFVSGQASFEDVNTKGEGYLDMLLMRPWPPGIRDAQWKLLKFLMLGSPAVVLRNPRLLHRCAKWIGEGPHMQMLDSLLSFDLDPGHLDASLFQDWPELCSPSWLAEDIAPDPMFVEFMRKCLQKQPGFGGCDDLSEALLTGNDAEFERAIGRALRGEALRTMPNALGQTAVHLAVLFQNRLEKLLEAGADPDCIDTGGSTPLMYAACYGASESATLLLEYGADLYVNDKRNGRYFIDYAVCRRHLKFIEDVSAWLRGRDRAAEALDVLNRSLAFSFAITNYRWDTSFPGRLLALGADPNILLWNQTTLMHKAKSTKQTQLLMASGFAAINNRDSKNRTPLMNIASLFDFSTLSWITDQKIGADVAAYTHYGHNAMHYLFSSARSNSWEVRDGQQTWHFTQRANMVSCLSVLLEQGAGVFAADNCDCACSNTGCTALTFALHKLRHWRAWPSYQTSPGPMIELLSLLAHHISQQDLAMCCHMIQRFCDFETQGYTHTCCRGHTEPKLDSQYLLSEQAAYERAKRDQVKFVTTLETPIGETNTLNYDSIITKFAQLCFMYEQQPLGHYTFGVLDQYNHSDESDEDDELVSFEIATKADCGYESMSRRIRQIPPQPRTYQNYDHKDWLQWCCENPNKLQVQGGSQAFVERALRLIELFEDDMHRLRSGNSHLSVQEPT